MKVHDLPLRSRQHMNINKLTNRQVCQSASILTATQQFDHVKN